MLESMIVNPRPTRAEISDVANACIDGSTCVMLSGETSAGAYPVETVTAMRKIVEECESKFSKFVKSKFEDCKDVDTAVGFAACDLANTLDVSSILVVTKSGKAAISVSRFRPNQIIIASTPCKKTYHKMSCLWGVYPIIDREFLSVDDLLASSKKKALQTKLVKTGDLFVEVTGLKAGVSGVNLIRVENY